MLRDARAIEDGALLESDVCIVGGGPAGITLARALAGTPLQVRLLESGGLDFDGEVQALYAGTNVGLPYYDLDVSRLRMFGGTTNHWTGRSVPLEAIDLERKDWVPGSGWPFGLDELLPYYRRAQEVMRLGPFEYERHFWHGPDERPLPLDPARLLHRFRQVHPFAFGDAYRAELEAAANVDVLLHANALSIEADAALRSVERVGVGTLSGRRFTCRGRTFVLACGGLETPRLLLASNRQAAAGLGNQHDNVGRYFMEHPVAPSAHAVVARPERFRDLYWYRDGAGPVDFLDHLALSPDAIRAERILNVSWRAYPDPERDPVNGFIALRRIMRALGRGEMPGRLGADLLQTLADPDDAVAGVLGSLGVRDYDLVPASCMLRTISEQAPDPDSRVLLDPERDALGMPRIRLDWRLNGLDRRSLEVAARLLAEEFGRAGIGRVRIADWLLDPASGWPPDLEGGWHHMGTTRMSDEPKAGVVDRDCRVHGLANLYVAGSAVFPTGGFANPTLTIVALALRLADRLRG